MSFGFPAAGPLCEYQSFTGLFFFRASFCWLFFITLKLFTYAKYDSNGLTFAWMNYICWGGNLVLQLAPLSQISYGNDDATSGYQPCTFMARPGAPEGVGDTVFTVVWFVPFLLCFFAISYMVWTIWSLQWARIQIMYPVGMCLFHLPNVFTSVIENDVFVEGGSDWDELYVAVNVTYCLSLLFGLYIAVLFHITNEEGRARWHALVFGEQLSAEEEEKYSRRSTMHTDINDFCMEDAEEQDAVSPESESDAERAREEGCLWASLCGKARKAPLHKSDSESLSNL